MSAVARRNNESGMALITVFLVMMVLSALSVGFYAAIATDQKANGIDRDQTQAYAAAHAGLEKLTSNMASLFVTDYSPSKAQIDAIIAKPPVITGFTYAAPGGAAGSGYDVSYPGKTNLSAPNFGNPVPEKTTGTPITAGPYAGFKGIVTPYQLTITARSAGGAEVRLRRELQTVAVPVFQFGVFSENDLTMYAGQNFGFGGRIQTNGNLFLAQLTGTTLTLSDRVTAFKEVVRANLSNGLAVNSVGFNGTVAVINSTVPTTRPLALTEGSVTGMPGVGQTLTVGPPSWTTISTAQTYYKSLLRNGLTGAKYLSLPLVSQGALPVDLIRRPPIPATPADSEALMNPLVFGQRYFGLGYPDNGPSLRILLSDTAAEITGLPTVTADAPVALTSAVAAVTAGRYGPVDATHPPLALSPGPSPALRTNGATANAATTISTNVAIPQNFVPQAVNVRVNNLPLAGVTCLGRSTTQLLGCTTPGLPAAAIGATVTGQIANGTGPAINFTTTLSAAAAVNATSLTVVSLAALPPSLIWVDDSGVDLPVTCTGTNDTRTQFTGCAGITSAIVTNMAISNGALSAINEPLLNGFIKIEMLNNNTPPAYVDITQEILNLGIAAASQKGGAGGVICGDPTPNAILRFQRLRDNYAATAAAGNAACAALLANSQNAYNYWPNMLYDTREGNFRDRTAAPADKTMSIGGMIGYISLDVANLKKWLAGNAAPFNAPGMRGASVNNQGASGYIVYFSDRRNNKCPAGSPSCPGATVPVETGEYGFEDMVNPGSADGVPNQGLDVGEDFNAITPIAPAVYVPVQDVYGAAAQNLPAGAAAPLNGVAVGGVAGAAATVAASTTTHMSVGMVNRPILFRRALKLINGGNAVANGASNMPPGLTVASENPVYVQGDYNANRPPNNNDSTWGETHVAAAVLADAVTLLSNSWIDANSFESPNDKAGRPANLATAYRFAVVAGKGLSFPFPANTPATASGYFLFGTDGGVGNFLRLLEDWTPGGVAKKISYRGSIVSLYTSRQAVGAFKCCERVYDYSLRHYTFDNDFLLPTLLPPGTPMFRDVNTLSFRQLLRPNQ